ncbi:MAG TPA: prepilin-type N-terminal cleavage/methylation domain-containing protein [Tepidisphaeraceae bacterium]|nr:prepilin-type N-terminal cleavage/methylation domain-containing protein [Tepidisphaeraceae bacterium]
MKQLHRTRAFTLVELLVVIGIIALLISILLPSLNRARETANRVKCAANLKSIGQSLLLYAGDNHGAYPRTMGANSSAALPTWGSCATSTTPFIGTPGAQRPYDYDISAALYLLLSTQDITGDVFVCPSSGATKWDFGGGSNTAQCWSNWNGASDVTLHISYSIQFPWGDSGSGFKWNSSQAADAAIMADINPGTPNTLNNVGSGAGGSSDNVLAVLPSSGASTGLKFGNSNNHDKDGQNVLYGDGHVDFQQTPFCGANGDNIYARRASSTNSQNLSDSTNPFMCSYDGKDSVLLPND